MSFISAHAISKQFSGTKALDEVSLDVPKSQIFGLLGPNGAGKTTFIRILNQILKPDGGFITIEGKPLEQSDISRIGYLPEERGLYKQMKVGEHVLYLASLKGMDRQTAQRESDDWFERFDIASWKNRRIAELSKGMQQKVQFIATVIHKPEILILDEPFSGFDPINAQVVKNEIIRLKNDGTTIILSTHNMNSVEELCDSIALIYKSKKILHGTMHEVRSHYTSNIFEITFTGYYNAMLATLTTSYKILSQTEENGVTTVQLELTEDVPTKNLIQHLMNSGDVQSFKPMVPGMNDIFIEAVNQHVTTN